MGVGVAETYKPEVLQSTDTSLKMTAQDLKSLSPCRQETDENFVVTDNINGEELRQHWPNMGSLLAKHDLLVSAIDAGEEDNVFLDVLSMLPGGADQSAKSNGLYVPDEDAILVDRSAIDRTKQDIAEMMMKPSNIEFACDPLAQERLDGASGSAKLGAALTPLHGGFCSRDQGSDVAAGSIRKDSVTAKNGDSAARPLPAEVPRNSVVQGKTKYEVAQRVAYWSDTHQTWMQAVVKKINYDRNGQLRTYDLDVKNGAQEHKITNLPSELEAASPEKKSTTDESTGAVHGQDRSVAQARSHLLSEDHSEVGYASESCASTCDTNTRPRERSPSREDPDVEFAVGDLVEYWSHTYKQWMAAVVENVMGEGCYDLDVKRSAQKNRIRKRVVEGILEVAEQPAKVSGAVSGGPSVQVGCPGPARQPCRRASCPDASMFQSPAVDSGVSQGLPAGKDALDPVAAVSTGALTQADKVFPRTQSPMLGGRMRPSGCGAIPMSQYAHRTVNSMRPEQRPQRGPSPISSRMRGFGLEQPPLDVVASGELNAAATPPIRKIVTPQPQGVGRSAGLQGKNSYASPVLRSRCVIGDGAAASRTPQSLQQPGLAAPPARGRGATSVVKQRDGAAEEVVARQTTGGVEEKTSRQQSIVASNAYMRPGGTVYANSSGPGCSACFVTPSSTAATGMCARSRSTGRNSLVPERMVQDLAVGDGPFDPSHPSVWSQLMAKLHLQGDAEVEEMAGFRGGLNDGVWFVNASPATSLVLKLVKGRRQHYTMPTEAESFVKLSQEFSEIGSDSSISFPSTIFSCIRPDGSKLHDLIVMAKAPGKRLAETIACKYISKEVGSLTRVFERVGRLLRELHNRYGNYQHGDFQPSNIMVDEETGRITLIDVGGMGPVTHSDTDVKHFSLSMDILAQSYGPQVVASCMQHFQSGYGQALSHR